MKYARMVNRFTVLSVMVILGMSVQLIAATCPCDIFKNGGTPCVGAYSTIRLLSSSYTGPLYQVRRKSDKTTKDIFPMTGGTIVNAAAQDSFLGTGAGSISKLYDQSGKGNDLTSAPAGTQGKTPDTEATATGHAIKVNGYSVNPLFMQPLEGYRNNKTTGVAVQKQSEGIYELVDGKRGTDCGCCCWDYGNAETNNAAGGTGMMSALYFGECGVWGKGSGNGPWFMGDFEAGVWSGGQTLQTNLKDSTITYPFALGILKTTQTNYTIRFGSAQSGHLSTAYSGQPPAQWNLGGAIILGIGGDNSNSACGTFYEGIMTSGQPADSTDSLVMKNIQNAGYGSTITSAAQQHVTISDANRSSQFNVRYNPSNANAIIAYSMQETGHLSMTVVDQRGKQIATVINGIVSSGKHEAAWDVKRVPPGVYIWRSIVDGRESAAGKIVIGQN
jgi:hypothetical protein